MSNVRLIVAILSFHDVEKRLGRRGKDRPETGTECRIAIMVIEVSRK